MNIDCVVKVLDPLIHHANGTYNSWRHKGIGKNGLSYVEANNELPKVLVSVKRYWFQDKSRKWFKK